MNPYQISHIEKEMTDSFSVGGRQVPDGETIAAIVVDTLSLLFPGFFQTGTPVLDSIAARLTEQTEIALRLSGTAEAGCDAEEITAAYISHLPEIKRILLTDVEAMYEGDPAARSREEIILCYPGFKAIAIYRLAHVLYDMNVPFIPRIMTEFAHEKTGVDIHPGAQIGEYFFIDHATGIVIGETTVIGDHVKIYQGVTLGAKSFEVDKNGNPVKNIKRHPNIGNNVVIYANATILGGKTYIGDNSIIGASTWIVESMPAGSRVLHSPKTENAELFWGDNGSGI